MAPLITCSHVTVCYGNHVVLKDIDFSLGAGEYLCIVGENGSGKTTLLKTLLGLKTPAAGSVVFQNGFQLRDIGYLPQQSDIQRDFPASVFEIVLSGFVNEQHKLRYTPAQKKAAQAFLAQLDAADLKDRCFCDLSGGQQQRVLLARALCSAKKLLVLDEPVSRLDPAACVQFYDLLRRINRELGIAVMMVSHDVEHATKDADYVLHLCNNAMCIHNREKEAQKTAQEHPGGQNRE